MKADESWSRVFPGTHADGGYVVEGQVPQGRDEGILVDFAPAYFEVLVDPRWSAWRIHDGPKSGGPLWVKGIRDVQVRQFVSD
jgi:hypothetical protein